MKVYIQTDIEGVAGFCFYENRRSREYEVIEHRHRMYRLLTAEVNAAVKAAFDAGADEVIVNDNHGSGYNIYFEDLDPRCRIIHGRNCSGPHWLPLLDKSFSAMILIGMHAMGGSLCSITPHSLWEVNDGEIYLSEGSMAAAIAGVFGVPTVMASGDDKITAELASKIPGLAVAEVKQALSPYMACSMVPAAACELIYAKVRDGLQRLSEIKPYQVPGPLKLQLLDSDDHCPPLKPIQEAVTADDINEAFLKYERAMAWTNFELQQPDGFVYP
jgi:D-amino peptidase